MSASSLPPPKGTNLIVVRVDTNRDGLFGLGCATFAYRHLVVACLVEQYLRPC
jgi:mannonate dehydratase